LVNRTRSYRNIASQFGVSYGAVSRHVNNGHIAERLLKAKVEDEARSALDVTRQLKAINSAALTILRDARDHDEPSLALRAIDRIHRQLELQAKLLGDLEGEGTINITLSPEWLQIRAVLVGSLEGHPQARDRLLKALEGNGNGIS
jgi:hypothetical protein